MMRFHTAITSGLAAVLVVPLLTQEGDLRTLQNALAGTTRALEALKAVGARIEADPPAGIQLILASTEAPVLDERARDERLQGLRDEVNLLRMHLDALEVPGMASAFPPAGRATTTGQPAPGATPGTVPLTGTTGMDDSVRRALRRLDDPLQVTEPAVPVTHEPSRLPEGPDYSADRLGQARANYRVGRYQEALDLLKDVGDDPVGLYWRARSLEKLDRIPEAIDLLARVIELAPDSLEGRRAKTDAEFLRWKKSFVEKLPKGLSDKKTGGGR